MKSALLIIAGVVIGIGLGLFAAWSFWGNSSKLATSQTQTQEPHPQRLTSNPIRSPITNFPGESNRPRPNSEDFQLLKAAREKALKDNPALLAEFISLQQQAQKQQKLMDAAVIKADPKVAAVLAKLEALQPNPNLLPIRGK